MRIASGIVAGLVLLVVLLFVGGSAYGRWRMDQVDQGLFQLAAQLGYTPERFIRHQVKSRDVNIVTGSAYRTSELYFLTPMSVDEFGHRLNEVVPETTGQMYVALPNPNTHLYSSLHLTANGVDVSRLENWDLQTPMSSYHWSQHKKEHNLYIDFYATMNISPTLAYGERPIAENLVRLYQEGGVFPIWVTSPGKTAVQPGTNHHGALVRKVAGGGGELLCYRERPCRTQAAGAADRGQCRRPERQRRQVSGIYVLPDAAGGYARTAV